ncbi:unnamed protein product [Ectocarpus sp. 12 AP-2014]
MEEAVRFAALAALQRVDESLRHAEDARNAAELMTVARAGSLPPTLPLS